MKKKVPFMHKVIIMVVSLVASFFLYLNVGIIGSQENSYSFSSNEGVYVIENIDIDYRYDKTKYEVVPLVNEPYAVIRGSKQLINLLKWSDDPEFFIELTGKDPGSYLERVQYTGINDGLTVEVYPNQIELKLMEQQTVKLTPTIELEGVEDVESNYLVSVPELEKDEVMIRDIQDRLNQISQVKGVVDVSNLTETTYLEVELKVYNRDGEVMEDINLIDKKIGVRIPIEEKVTIVHEEIIQEIVVVEEPKSPNTGSSSGDSEDNNKDANRDKEGSNKPNVSYGNGNNPNSNNGSSNGNTNPSTPPSQPKIEGVLSFVNIPSNLELKHHTSNLKWSNDVKVDLKDFTRGSYEITLDDNGTKKVVKFDLISLEVEEEEETDGGEVEKAQTVDN